VYDRVFGDPGTGLWVVAGLAKQIAERSGGSPAAPTWPGSGPSG